MNKPVKKTSVPLLEKFLIVTAVLILVFFVFRSLLLGLTGAFILHFLTIEEIPWLRTALVLQGYKKVLILLFSWILILSVPLSFFATSPLSNDSVPLFFKAFYSLDYFSTYSSIEGKRLHNDCLFTLQKFRNFDESALTDEDQDGYSNYCEAFDNDYLIAPTINQKFGFFLSDGEYFNPNSAISIKNPQAIDIFSSIQNYEIILSSFSENKKNEIIDTCIDPIKRDKSSYLCNLSEETKNWISDKKVVFMTIKGVDGLRIKKNLVQNVLLLLN